MPAAYGINACATSPGVLNRSAGSRASILAMIALSGSGKSCRRLRAAGASRTARAISFSIAFFPRNGTSPVISLNSVQPRLKMSARVSTPRVSWACSGEI